MQNRIQVVGGAGGVGSLLARGEPQRSRDVWAPNSHAGGPLWAEEDESHGEPRTPPAQTGDRRGDIGGEEAPIGAGIGTRGRRGMSSVLRETSTAPLIECRCKTVSLIQEPSSLRRVGVHDVARERVGKRGSSGVAITLMSSRSNFARAQDSTSQAAIMRSMGKHSVPDVGIQWYVWEVRCKAGGVAREGSQADGR